ncbi:MAG: acetyl-CoA carboxylase biotin carboxylase subunit [Actinobacteria bacterium]|nr:acetyl-CoA carboxylase biotin carboxylase subunit [Actinomycetota bacterium]
MFKKILVANRGEIALRIIMACKEINIKTVAIYSEADSESLHVKFADEAICVGPPQSIKSYLNMPNIISAAELTGAEAIHPGYGFLAENPQFAEICESCKITFIGPSPKTIEQAGNKANAKKIMEEAGIPVIPGSKGVIKTEKEAVSFAQKVGYPVIIKASAGGGGRGMRIVQGEQDLLNAISTAKSEAEAAFGNSEIYLEKYVEEPRHIEFQILGDKYGNVIHLGERDCSVQRRHQKLIEESPSTALSEKLRKKIGDAAIKAAKKIKYTNAGTIEFLVDIHGNFYFMEINTRIQVEHPVTEMVTGVDIVKEQIKSAVGEKLNYHQSDIKLKGHAIEFRINAEDPDKDFMPAGGKINFFNPPGGPGVRLDTHLYSEYDVPTYYDSLLAKLIVWGENREEAIARGQRALNEFIIMGLATTIPFHLKVLDNAFFRKGEVYTNFIQRRILSK